MKGFFFAKPLEFRLEALADQLAQGDAINGTLHLKNRAGKPCPGRLEIGLAYGRFKKIKEGAPNAFEMIERKLLTEQPSLPPDGEISSDWAFQLKKDCPVTSKDGALFLLYGANLDQSSLWSKLDLQVTPCLELEILLAILENRFQFAVTSAKFEQGFTEYRLKTPESYPTMDSFILRARVNEEAALDLDFRFRIKRLARGPEAGVKAGTEKFLRSISAKDYMNAQGQPDRGFLQEMVRDVLSNVVQTH